MKERWHRRKGRKSMWVFFRERCGGIKPKKKKEKKLFNANYVEQTLQQLSTDIHQLHRMRRSNNYLFQYPIIIINIRSREGTTRDKFDDECVCILLKMIDEKTKRANEITETNSSQRSRRWTIRLLLLLLSSIRMISSAQICRSVNLTFNEFPRRNAFLFSRSRALRLSKSSVIDDARSVYISLPLWSC